MKNITIYQSNGAEELFVEKDKGQLTPYASDTQEVTISINEQMTYQEVDGFGASFTDSAAYLMNQVLEPDQREQAMKKLFDPHEGIGLSVLRNPMGASDYARDFYSYNDLPEGDTDISLSKFTIAHDEQDIIPLVQEALSLNPEIKLMGSPWSPPAWMKTSGSMIGGELKKEYYSTYANYFVKYIQAYAKHGLPMYAITPQNEALYSPGHYPGMIMLPEVQSEFIKDHLKPSFVENGISTKILCYDHNWDEPNYPRHVLQTADDAVDGVAWHWYGGAPSAQSDVYHEMPTKEVHFTEGSGGEWIPAFEPAFSNVMRTGIEIIRNYSKTLVLWNMALDENNGPAVPGFGNSTCRGIVQVNQQTKELTYTLDYYALAHFSKCIRPQAVRLETESTHAQIRVVSVRNKDNSIALVLFNDSDEKCNASIELPGEETIVLGVEAKSAVTIHWKR